MQALLLDKEGDIGPEVRASGFEREHEVTLEMWNAQRPAELDEDSPEDDAPSNSDSGSSSNAEVAEAEHPDRSRDSNGAAASYPSNGEAVSGVLHSLLE